ncbi:class I SAM-dependent methyltransferase [Streptomyces sp. PLAI1-29]|uniref:Class I SAM-dependent methyltransferase n=2 Tax=Streptomyces zingiberis TaxID=2053010 RepID=A0ABX1BQC8_9ACTN|nr:class I SAM-dependent methyltransferase [Streptomyces zingiberis]
MPVGDEPDVVERLIPRGAHILELGCGAGRVTHPLLERGYTVTAVDESPEMLERVRGARTVRSPIEELDLGTRFDAVMLASFLVHAGDPAVRRGLLATCRRHVAEGGAVLIQREPEDAHTRVPRERAVPGGGLVRIAASEPVAPGVRAVRCVYEFPGARWTQTFLSRPLTTETFEEALAEAGLVVDRYATEDRTWVLARAAH